MDSERKKEKDASDRVLAEFFQGVDPSEPPFIDAVDFYDQEELIEQLTSFHWEGLNDAIYRVFQRVVASKASDLGQQLARDDLALACAKRLAGRGHDAEIRSYFRGRITAVRRQLVKAGQNEPKLPPGDAGYGPALFQRTDMYQELLRKLSVSHQHDRTSK